MTVFSFKSFISLAAFAFSADGFSFFHLWWLKSKSLCCWQQHRNLCITFHLASPPPFAKRLCCSLISILFSLFSHTVTYVRKYRSNSLYLYFVTGPNAQRHPVFCLHNGVCVRLDCVPMIFHSSNIQDMNFKTANVGSTWNCALKFHGINKQCAFLLPCWGIISKKSGLYSKYFIQFYAGIHDAFPPLQPFFSQLVVFW